ncbi:MAG: serine hydrolase, partial [Acidobacteria bacterium]|nr:serine hydrolase [Acidobacteriota bacterium]
MTSFIRLTIVLLCLTPLLVPGLGRAAGADEPQPLASALEDVITEWAVPGMAVTVVKDGIVVFAQGFGTRRIGSDLPVTPQTRFSIGSCTKAFTAAALATLVDQDR